MFIAIHPTAYRSGGFLAHGVLNLHIICEELEEMASEGHISRPGYETHLYCAALYDEHKPLCEDILYITEPGRLPRSVPPDIRPSFLIAGSLESACPCAEQLDYLYTGSDVTERQAASDAGFPYLPEISPLG